MTSGATLQLKELQRYYDNFGAVRGVSLSLDAGQFLTLLGPSGSGKTTTLMMIAGFIEPTAGEIVINGRPVTHTDAHKRDIGMVFQNYALFPHMTVIDNVAFPLKMRGVARAESRARAAQFVARVGLERFGHRYPSQLSGGQQQRVALARALVFSPSLVLMDEPLGALDRRLRLQMQEEIKNLQTELGLTVVYVTHDQEEALTMSDRVAVMENGRIACYGTPREIYEAPNNRFVAGFIGESNFIPCDLRRQEQDRAVVAVAPESEVQVLMRDRQPAARAGEENVIFIRPERMHLCQDSDHYQNKLPVQVLGEIYLGDASLYRVRLAGGQEVRVKRPNRGIGLPVQPGDRCYVGWQIDDGILLRH
ncbi:Spermidine/putrescine ABC transporter ATP-binding subunit [Sodalis praecaptivus]|uniref:Spermidine/putrescine import ATP-binding protein PotA n=1 Tax=Sodalis praecaptivus TaxID=1239307 RepID=W0HWU4_9GAMM|nr:ABC transporter ATP-binding protein [Sodalis praecaptivus]AHF76623.1 Spermidine/putrescine ABC transporter ATP-binding subunit [Sodalis praecaptivus]